MRGDKAILATGLLGNDGPQPRSFWSITVRISAPNFSCMRCTTGSAMARLRAPAPLAGRGAAGFAATGAPPLTILNFSGLPAALLSAV